MCAWSWTERCDLRLDGQGQLTRLVRYNPQQTRDSLSRLSRTSFQAFGNPDAKNCNFKMNPINSQLNKVCISKLWHPTPSSLTSLFSHNPRAWGYEYGTGTTQCAPERHCSPIPLLTSRGRRLREPDGKVRQVSISRMFRGCDYIIHGPWVRKGLPKHPGLSVIWFYSLEESSVLHGSRFFNS